MTPPAIKVTAKIEGADRTSDVFKAARRDVYRKTRHGMKAAGEKAILPLARRSNASRTPIAGAQIVVKTTARYGYLTTKTRKAGRIVGLLNFGGVVREPIRPKRKKAIAWPGVVVSQVKTARRYSGSHFLEDARDRGMGEFGRILLPELMSAFDPLDHTP